jgi:hypothetical protein
MLVVLTVVARMAMAAPFTLPGTGVDAAGGLLSLGATDAHYSILSSPVGGSQNAFVSSNRPASWVANTAESQWINPTGNGGNVLATGTWVYERHFNLTGMDYTTAQVVGRWASDNSSKILLNEVDTGFQSPPGPNNDLGVLTAFTLSGGFRDGDNTLRFDVVNAGSQSGLQVDIQSATANVPEPSSAALGGVACLWMLRISMRKPRVRRCG